MRAACLFSLATVAAFLLPATSRAQDPDTVTAEPAAPFFEASEAGSGVGPGGAFWRSVVIPGWGHAVIGAHSRGAFYFAAASGVTYMVVKSLVNRGHAQRARDARAEVAEDRLRLAGTPEDSIPLLVMEDEAVADAQDLVDTRSQQIQDWAALGAFLLLLSGADAFVSAHLMDFPEPLSIDVYPGGQVQLQASIPFRWPG